MTHKMHAAVVEQFGKPLVLKEWDIPTPGPGQIAWGRISLSTPSTAIRSRP